MNITIPRKGAKKRASPHGIFFNQPNIPFAPNSRPLVSKVAKSEKAVINEGTTTNIVKTTCKYFQNGSIPGSVNWWWNPTGIEKNSNNTNDNLANESEKIFPPITLGITAYHIIYAGMSQKYTSG